MTVRARLLALGAVLPVAALIALAAVAGLLLSRRLHDEIDESLLAQAAVESVGLFDGPDGEPHLHAYRSPLAADLRGIVGVAAIYEESGRLLVQASGTEALPATLRHAGRLGAVSLRTAPPRGEAPARRELVTAVRSPAGSRYTLYVAASLDRLQTTMRRYWTAAGLAVGGIGLLLLGAQLLLAARLARRVVALHAYLPRLREGQSEPPPPPDASGDELAALRDGLYDAARELERVRAERERDLAHAAHELRTPLGVIRTTVDLALRKPRGEAELREALAEVRGESVRLTALADALLAQRRAPHQREDLDLAELVETAVRAIAPLADEAGVELCSHLPQRPDGAPAAPLTGDAVALRRVVDNLLHNAITHSPRRGRVDVDLQRDGAVLRLAVRDQGPGIAAAELERVFQPFVRGPESRGAGLGLSIVRQIAVEHGGAAWAEPGPGGRLFVELSATGSAAAP